MSGGQEQGPCITRTPLRNPRILALSDSISVVGTVIDARIRGVSRAAIPGAIKIIIAQRISNTQYTDHVLVIKDGHINGYGTDDQLVRSSGIYREMCEP